MRLWLALWVLASVAACQRRPRAVARDAPRAPASPIDAGAVTLAFAVGDWVAMPGVGLLRVLGREDSDGEVMLRLEQVSTGMKIGVPLGRGRLRPLVSRAEAERLLAILRSPGQPDDRHSVHRYRDYKRILMDGSFEDQVLALQRQYSSRFKVSGMDWRWVDMYEEVIIHELAQVLGGSTEAVRQDLHAVHPAFDDRAAERPPEPDIEPRPQSPIALPRHTYLGQFTVAGGQLVWSASRPGRPRPPRWALTLRAAS